MGCRETCFTVLLILFKCSVGQEVRLRQGVARGTEIQYPQGLSVFAYRGIPYAAPPTGENRFKSSRPHEGWQGVLPALEFGPPCPQPSGSREVRERMREDCLFVNVWTPQRPDGNNNKRRPVVIFFEGQLFTLSNPSDVPAEDFVAANGDELIFVSASYRTNAFGFLSFDNNVLPGNVGLGDQALAIKWTFDNIGLFGGDPERITLMGHSTGAASVLHHLSLKQESSSYINGAIIMSGSALAPWATQPNPAENARRLAELLNCDGGSDAEILECLQSQSVESITGAVDDLISGGNVSAIFAPTINDNNNNDNFGTNDFVIHASLEEDIRRGNLKQVPILVSSVLEEGLLMAYFLQDAMEQVAVEQLKSFAVGKILPSILPQLNTTLPNSVLTPIINFQYFSDVNSTTSRGEMSNTVSKFFNEFYFSGPMERQIRLLSDRNDQVYFAVNSFETRQPQDIFGNGIPETRSSHGVDLLYLFGPSMYRKFLPGRLDDLTDPRSQFPSFAEERLSRNMKAIFGEFVSTGRPIRSFSWPSYRSEDRAYYDIAQGRSGTDFQPNGYRFWHEFLPELEDSFGQSSSGKDEVDEEDNDTASNEGLLSCSSYAAFTWSLMACVVILILALIILVLAIMFWKRRRRKREREEREIFTVSNSVLQGKGREAYQGSPPMMSRSSSRRNYQRQQEQQQYQQQQPANWRESVMDFRM